jgi:hypothetical protein
MPSIGGAFDPQLAHSLHEGGSPLALRRRSTRTEQSDGRRLRLLRARRERPRCRRTADQLDEVAYFVVLPIRSRAVVRQGCLILIKHFPTLLWL